MPRSRALKTMVCQLILGEAGFQPASDCTCAKTLLHVMAGVSAACVSVTSLSSPARTAPFHNSGLPSWTSPYSFKMRSISSLPKRGIMERTGLGSQAPQREGKCKTALIREHAVSPDSPQAPSDEIVDIYQGKRKHQQRINAILSSQDTVTGAENESSTNSANIGAQNQPKSDDTRHDNSLGWILTLTSETRHMAIRFREKVFVASPLDVDAPSNLPTLVRLNTISALASNAVALSIPFLDLDRRDRISPFNLQGPFPVTALDGLSVVPPSLQPTTLQKTVNHHPWIDLLPIPGIRDNILRCLEAALIDEHELCHDLLKADDTEGALAPFVVWAEPCNPENWEISPRFLRKWSLLVQDCPQVIDATNYWRQKRGQGKISLVVE